MSCTVPPPPSPPCRSQLISFDAIKWLLELLGNLADLSEYTVEYAVALLMNLCLRSAGKQRCVADAPGTLDTLCNLLDHENDQVRTYIHGTLYSLLSAPAIRKAALAMEMEVSRLPLSPLLVLVLLFCCWRCCGC